MNQSDEKLRWLKVPKEMRDEIWRTYKKDKFSAEHVAAVRKAVRYLKEINVK